MSIEMVKEIVPVHVGGAVQPVLVRFAKPGLLDQQHTSGMLDSC